MMRLIVVISIIFLTACQTGTIYDGSGNPIGEIPEPPPKTIKLAWDPVNMTIEDDPIEIIEYRLYMGLQNDKLEFLKATPETKITVEGLKVGKRYFFSVSALGSNGLESQQSTQLEFVP